MFRNFYQLPFRYTILIISLLLSEQVYCQTDSVVMKMIELHRTDNQTMHQLDVLCNRFGGRLIGSDAFDNAAEWVAREFSEWGLEVVMDEAGELPLGFNRGPWFGRLLSDNGMILHFATPSYTVGTKGIQRGPVLLEPKTRAEFDRMKKALKGSWVLITGKSDGWPIDYSEKADHKRDSIRQLNEEIEKQNNEIRHANWRNRHGEAPEKELIPMEEEPAIFYREMCEAGILGIIQAAETPIRVLYDRKNIHDMRFDSLPMVPDIKLDEHQYALIAQMARERRYFELEFDIRNHFRLGPVKYHNVIGILPGTEFPNEYVIVGGHLDAFDVGTGGIDDGSGASVTIEAARMIMRAGVRPKRTILFILFAGEEFGLYGSKSWIERNEDKLSKISNMFNRDGGPTVPVGMSVPDAMRADFETICAPLGEINPDFPFTLSERKTSERPEEPWGTDSGPFAVRGVPTLGFDCRDTKGYNFDYGEIWHTERDLYTKSIPEYQEHAAVVTAIVAWGVANLDHQLSREGYYFEEK